MPTFQRKSYPSSTLQSSIAAKYRSNLSKHPFALFGLPFILTMLAGSFVLTPATAMRYQHHDAKVQRLTKEEEMKLNLGDKRRGRKVDMREEYFRLAAKEGGRADWEQKRIKRFEGESDGIL